MGYEFFGFEYARRVEYCLNFKIISLNIIFYMKNRNRKIHFYDEEIILIQFYNKAFITKRSVCKINSTFMLGGKIEVNLINPLPPVITSS